MENTDKITAFSNAFRLSINENLAIFEFGFGDPSEEVLTDDNVEKVATVGMQIGLLEVIKQNIEDVLENYKTEK